MSETIGASDHAVDHAAPGAPSTGATSTPTSSAALLPPPSAHTAAAPGATHAATAPVPPPPAPPAPAPAAPAPAAPAPAAQVAPVLPTNVAAKPSAPVATTNTPNSSAFDVGAFLSSQNEKRKAPRKPRGRWFLRLAMVGLLGAGGWFGVQHGPELYDQYVEGDEAGAQNEPDAPLAFPNITAATAPIRTAEFTLTGLAETPNSTYRVTTDFETAVSQVDITRENGPALQILTYGTDAMIRRADGDQWYILDRGQFPLDGRLQRTDWVRSVDELLPVEIRDRVVIETATRSTVAGVATRHLTLNVDPGVLGAAPVSGIAPGDVAAPPQDTEAAAPPAVDGAVGSVIDDVTGAEIASTSGVRMEIWIDASGLVRQASGVPQLGADTITIISTSPDAWIPAYPAATDIVPLTASALVELGL